MKEMTSEPVGLSFPGLDALSLFLHKIAGQQLIKKGMNKRVNIFPSPSTLSYEASLSN